MGVWAMAVVPQGHGQAMIFRPAPWPHSMRPCKWRFLPRPRVKARMGWGLGAGGEGQGLEAGETQPPRTRPHDKAPNKAPDKAPNKAPNKAPDKAHDERRRTHGPPSQRRSRQQHDRARCLARFEILVRLRGVLEGIG